VKQATNCLLAGSFSLAIIISSYVVVGPGTHELTQSNTTVQTSSSEKAAAWDPTRYAPVYGHIPYWSKRLGYWIATDE
jgi:hypothetical protein